MLYAAPVSKPSCRVPRFRRPARARSIRSSTRTLRLKRCTMDEDLERLKRIEQRQQHDAEMAHMADLQARQEALLRRLDAQAEGRDERHNGLVAGARAFVERMDHLEARVAQIEAML